jgi:Family of unknown function (DUF6941)
MPELDYMVLADYVRQDGDGAIHIMGAGIDTIAVPVVPTMQPLGIALRITFGTTEEAGEPHRLTLGFQSPDERVFEATAAFFTPARPPGVPEHWRTAIGVALRLAVPLPKYGDYSVELDIDDGTITRSIDIRVVPLPDPAQN